MNIGDLVTIAREDYLDDNTKDSKLWNDQFMLRAFTEAQRQACNRTDFLFDELEVTLVDGSVSYVLDTRITKIDKVLFEGKQVEKVSLSNLDYKTPSWPSETGMTGKTIKYMIRGNRIRFVPSPTADDDGLPVTLECYVLPDDKFSSFSDEPVIGEEFHTDLVYYVLYLALSKRDADSFDIRANEYLDKFTAVFGPYVPARVRLHQMENAMSLVLAPHNYNDTASREIDPDADW